MRGIKIKNCPFCGMKPHFYLNTTMVTHRYPSDKWPGCPCSRRYFSIDEWQRRAKPAVEKLNHTTAKAQRKAK